MSPGGEVSTFVWGTRALHLPPLDTDADVLARAWPDIIARRLACSSWWPLTAISLDDPS